MLELHDAFKADDLEECERLLSLSNTDINEYDEKNRTVLSYACEYGDIDAVDLFLQFPRLKINKFERIKPDDAPLLLAYEKSKWPDDDATDILERLVADRRTNVNYFFEGNSIFHLACYEGNLLALDILLKSDRFNINIFNKAGKTGGQLAAAEGHLDIVARLIKENGDFGTSSRFVTYLGQNVNELESKALKRTLSPLLLAYEKSKWLGEDVAGSLEQLVADQDTDVNYFFNGNSIFHLACYEGNLLALEILLKSGRFDINKFSRSGKTGLRLACAEGHVDIIKRLIRENVDLDSGSHFQVACANNQVKVLQLLLHYAKIDLNKTSLGNFPIHSACHHGQKEMVELLLSHPRSQRAIDINERNAEQETALFIACKYDHLETVRYLLKQPGIDVNAADNTEQSPLYFACLNDRLEMIELLLTHPQIDTNQRDNNKNLPLFAARENIAIIKLLLSNAKTDINLTIKVRKPHRGPNIGMKENEQNNGLNIIMCPQPEACIDDDEYYADSTLFSYACKQGWTEIVEFYMQHTRLNLDKINTNEIPFYQACSKGQTEIVRLMLNDQRFMLYKVNEFGELPLFAACANNHIAIVKLLHERGHVTAETLSRSNDLKISAYQVACKYQYHELLEFLKSTNIPLEDPKIVADRLLDEKKKANDEQITSSINFFKSIKETAQRENYEELIDLPETLTQEQIVDLLKYEADVEKAKLLKTPPSAPIQSELTPHEDVGALDPESKINAPTPPFLLNYKTD